MLNIYIQNLEIEKKHSKNTYDKIKSLLEINNNVIPVDLHLHELVTFSSVYIDFVDIEDEINYLNEKELFNIKEQSSKIIKYVNNFKEQKKIKKISGIILKVKSEFNIIKLLFDKLNNIYFGEYLIKNVYFYPIIINIHKNFHIFYEIFENTLYNGKESDILNIYGKSSYDLPENFEYPLSYQISEIDTILNIYIKKRYIYLISFIIYIFKSCLKIDESSFATNDYIPNIEDNQNIDQNLKFDNDEIFDLLN